MYNHNELTNAMSFITIVRALRDGSGTVEVVGAVPSNHGDPNGFGFAVDIISRYKNGILTPYQKETLSLRGLVTVGDYDYFLITLADDRINLTHQTVSNSRTIRNLYYQEYGSSPVCHKVFGEVYKMYIKTYKEGYHLTTSFDFNRARVVDGKICISNLKHLNFGHHTAAPFGVGIEETPRIGVRTADRSMKVTGYELVHRIARDGLFPFDTVEYNIHYRYLKPYCRFSSKTDKARGVGYATDL